MKGIIIGLVLILVIFYIYGFVKDLGLNKPSERQAPYLNYYQKDSNKISIF
jgi:hypothetical protein